MTSSVSNVGSISSAGLGSGLDVNSIITQLMAVESKPLDALKTAASGLNTKISTFGKIQGLFSTLQSKANALTSLTLWSQTTATPSDTSAIKVTTGSGSAAGSYSVNVQKLAVAQTATAAAQPSADSQLNAGTLKIELGTWTGDVNNPFAAKTGSSPITVEISENDTSLTAIRDKINAAGAGVVASIVNDASGARLSIRSKDTGAENAFRLTATETFDDGDDTKGLSILNYDQGGGPSQMTLGASAIDAQLQINGISVRSASNTLTDVVDGLSLTLMKETASPVSVAVAADTASIKTKITEFVTAYNDIANQLRTQTVYDSDTKTAGTLQGDSAAVSLLNQLRTVINVASSASSTFTRLSDVGITMGSDGTLSVDDAKLTNAMGNLPELKKVLTATGADSASSGFIRRYKALADAALSTGGTFDSKNTSLQSMLSRNTKSQDDMQNRLDQTEARLRRQYTALDGQMASLNSLSSYVTQQMAMLAKSSSSS